MTAVTGAHVEAAVSEMQRVLLPHASLDWHVSAGHVEWSCWETAAHVAHDVAAYAGQVTGRATAGYLPFDLVVAPSAPAQLLEVVDACGRLLSLAVDHAEPGPLAWHWGMSDASGFAAMGVAEVLVHTHDITVGLGIEWAPPEDLSRLVIDRLVPDAPARPAAPDVLLWATGRADLDDEFPRRTDWVWRSAVAQ